MPCRPQACVPRCGPDPVQVIAVTGGKGGVGKTSVAVNLAAALAAQGERVLLFDGDLGLANVDVLMGLTPRHNLEHVLDGALYAGRGHRAIARQALP